MTLKLFTYSHPAKCLVRGSMLGVVGLVSVYFDYVRQ